MREVVEVGEQLLDDRQVEPEPVADRRHALLGRSPRLPGEDIGRVARREAEQEERQDDDADHRRHRMEDGADEDSREAGNVGHRRRQAIARSASAT